MKKRDLIIVVVVLAFGMFYNFVESGEIAFSKGCSFSNRTLRDRQHPNSFPRKALTFTASEVSIIEIDNRAGGIDVIKSEDDSITIKPEVRIYHRRKERARDIEKDIKILTRVNSEGKVHITINPDKDFPFTRARIYFKISAPENTKLDLWNRYGDIDVKGCGENIIAEGKHGDVKIRNVNSGIRVKHRHGKVILYAIKGDVDLSSSHSRISIDDIKGLELRSAHSVIAVDKVENATEADVSHSRFNLRNGAGFKLKGRHNILKLENIRNGVSITDSHSRVSLEDISGDIQIKARHSGIKLQRIEAGNVVVRNSHQSVRIEDITAKTVDVLTRNGRVTLDIRHIEERINIKNRHGSIRLYYPESLNPMFNIDLKYGNLKNKTDAEFTLIKDRSRLRFNTLEGSPNIIVNNTYGDLYLNRNSLKPLSATAPKPETETFTEPEETEKQQ